MTLGAGLGLALGDRSAGFKPFGDLFLNLLFTAAVPLVFFSISSSIAQMSDLRKLGRIMGGMFVVFVITGMVAASLMLLGVTWFPPALTGQSFPGLPENFRAEGSWVQILQALAVPDFPQLFSKQNMLAMIVFAFLTGLSASLLRERGTAFTDFLVSGSRVMMKVVHLIMFYAPVGLGAYFAYLAGNLGPDLLGSYFKVAAVYYPFAILYFFAGSSLYAWLAGGSAGWRRFWSCVVPPALTAWGTGSSVATIPVNLEAADRIGVSKEVSRIVIPIGATVHMDGTCMAAIVKISLLFSFFGIPFHGFETYAGAVGISLLCGLVMGGIPGGGFLGEVLIVTLYGFPVEALPIISMVGILVDPPATMVNATGDTTASMLLSRILNGKKWIHLLQNTPPRHGSD
jgi:Na+/H+-dicarboxylate symporter